VDKSGSEAQEGTPEMPGGSGPWSGLGVGGGRR
jgi:hypothetical protein